MAATRSKPPQDASQFSGAQIVIQNGRITANATTDHLLLSAALTVYIGGKTGVHLASPALVALDAPKVYLSPGAWQEREAALRGTSTIRLLKRLVKSLRRTAGLLGQTVSTPVGSPLPQLATAGTSLDTALASVEAELDRLASPTVFLT